MTIPKAELRALKKIVKEGKRIKEAKKTGILKMGEGRKCK